MAVNNYVSVPELTIKSDVLSTDMSFKLQNIQWYVGSDGVAVNLAVADFGSSGIGYGVFDERTSSQEFFTWDTTTLLSATTTGITILKRGLPWGSDYTTEATTRKFFHASGSRVLLFTNAPAFYDTFVNKANDETITGKITFPTGTNYPLVGGSYSAPTNDLHVATKKYVDGVALAGAPDATTAVKGVSELATGAELAAGTATGGTGANLVAAASSFKNSTAGAGDANKVPVLNASGVLDQTFLDSARTWGAVQSFSADNCQITTDPNSANDAVRGYANGVIATLTTGEAIDGSSTPQVVCMKSADGLVYKADANDNTRVQAFGFITTNALISTTPAIRTTGIIGGFTGLTKDAAYYVSDTAGSVSATPSTTCSIPVGLAISTTELLVNFKKKIATGTITHTAAGAGTQDVTTTIGFLASTIVLGGYLLAKPGGGSDVKSAGINAFFGTALGFASVSLSDGSTTAVTGKNIGGYVGHSAYDVTSETISTNACRGVLSMNAVSSTGFTTRVVNTTTGGAGGNVNGAFTFVAFE